MTLYDPRQIERARRSIVTHNPQIPAQLQRVSRMVQWLILRDSRPPVEAPQGQIIRFPLRPQPALHHHGGHPGPGDAA